MMPFVNIVVSFSLVHVGQSEWCDNAFDAPYAVQPFGGFENCETEAAGGLSKCWGSSFYGGKKVLQQGCRKACTKCEASGADTCNETSWPDKLSGIVCGECKVLVNKFEGKYRTCARYCASLGLPCTGAWEQWEQTCAVKHEITCDKKLSSSDAICECLPASSKGAAASTILQAKVSGGMANDNTDGVTSDADEWDGSIRFVVSAIVGSSLVACLLCLSMFMFFRWKQAVSMLRQRTDSDCTYWSSTSSDQSSAEVAGNVVMGNPMHDSQADSLKPHATDAVPADGVVVGNPVNVGGHPVTPLSGGSQNP